MKDNKVFSIHVALFYQNASSKMEILRFASLLQDVFRSYFPKEPQILPMPADAPAEAPRCVFSNDENVSLTFSLERIDFRYNNDSLKEIDWKNQVGTIALNLFNVCEKVGLHVTRVGFVVLCDSAEEVQNELNQSVHINGFPDSDEKRLSFLVKKTNGELKYNLITMIVINENEPLHNSIVQIDANTDRNIDLEMFDKDIISVISILTDAIEEKLCNVFK